MNPMMNRTSSGASIGTINAPGVPQRPALRRCIATWNFNPSQTDELSLCRGDILLVADEFPDGWMRGLRLSDLEIGFFPAGFVAEDTSPIYKLKDIKCSTEHYVNDPKFIEFDSSKRSKIALEVYTSEEAYLNKLRMLNEKFVVPLSQNHGVISHEDYNAVFSNIVPLLGLSEALLVQLKSRMEAWDEKQTRMGDIFMLWGHHMKLFVTYAVQHTLGSQILTKITGQDKFKLWLEKTELECQRTLNSLLLEPIQRVPRYELLLKDLLKHTTEEHPDHPTLKEALNFVQKIAIDCNENIRRAENELKLYTITKRFPHDELNLITAKWIKPREKSHRTDSFGTLRRKKRDSADSPLRVRRTDSSLSVRSFFESEHQRTFVKEGTVQKTKPDYTDPTERYLLLCSDVLLIAQVTGRSRKTFKLKERVMLAQAWTTDTSNLTTQDKIPENGFILGTPKKVYHFLAGSAEEKNTWFQELQSRIFAQKRLFNQLLSHLSVPDENFRCAKVKAKVSYLGMLEDELSFKNGDEVSVVGFKNAMGKWKPGLYSQKPFEPFDPSPEWYFGVLNGNAGWFPSHCVLGTENRLLEAPEEDTEPTAMCTVLNLKQRMVELTGRIVPPLTETERTTKVFLGEGNFKTLRIPPQCSVEDIVRMYFKVKPDSFLSWTLIEQSLDGTVHREVNLEEDPSEIVDFWGKSRDRMRFLLKQSVINHVNHHDDDDDDYDDIIDEEDDGADSAH